MTYKCEYCGLEYEGAECPTCGAPHPAAAISNSNAVNSNETNNHSTNIHIADIDNSNNYTTNTTIIYDTDSDDTNSDDTNMYTMNTTDFDATSYKKKKQKRSVTERPWFVKLLLLFFFPAGLYFMWKNKVFKLLTRIVITSFFAVIIYAFMNMDGTVDTINSSESGSEKAVEAAVTDTPAASPISTPAPTSTPAISPAPTKKPLSKKEKFVKKVVDLSGTNEKTAGSLYDLFLKKMGFDKVSIIQKSDKGKITYDFKADDFNLKVALKKNGVTSIKWGYYILYEDKVIKIDKKGLLARQLIDPVKYYLYVEDIIDKNIKTPSTSKFPVYNASGVSMQRKGKIVGVQGYFDAENTYGALVRSKYTIEFSVTDLDANIYKAVYINIDGEVTGKWVDLD